MKACNQCGKCCLKYSEGGLSATSDEIDFWEAHRPDIYKYVKDGEIWMDPKTGKPLDACPWLSVVPNTAGSKIKYQCDIYDDRPDDCKYYPVTVSEMIIDECEMLEPKDLVNLKQAQKKLDLLMIDSRPPMED